MLHLRTRLLPLLRTASRLPSSIRHPTCLLSTSTAPFSLEDYLVAACGLAPAQARKTAKKAFDKSSQLYKKAFEDLARSGLSSPSNPDAILALLSGVGLSRADIAAVVAADPLLLCSRSNNIGSRLFALRDLGLSVPEIVRLLLVGSRSLRNGDILPQVQFLISFYGSFEQVLVVVKRNNSLLNASLERVIEPNIALFRQFGVRDIAQMCLNNPRLLTFNLERVKDFLLRAEELGVPRTSAMFKYAVSLVASNSKEKVAAKSVLLKRILGGSESDVYIAMSKMPTILSISEESLTHKIDFLINEVGMEPQYILKRIVLLGYSVEKRLRPRHRVMKALQAKGLLKSNWTYFSLVIMGEDAFILKFIDCHKDSVPGLAAYYAKACAGDVPPEVQLSS